MDFKIVAIIKREIFHGENHVNKVTESASRKYGIIIGMYVKKWWPLEL